MKVTIVSMEIPYPPIHGGRVDIWRRLIALSKLGVEIQLVCWNDVAPSAEEIAEIQKYVKQLHFIVYQRGIGINLQRGFGLFKYPLQVTSRILRGQQWENLLRSVEQFSPDVIIADQVHSGYTARRLSDVLKCPYVLRSHNIEHLHYSYWLQSAKGWGKLKLILALLHLKTYELSILKSCDAFYDISVDDLKFWQKQGFTHGRFLAPLADLSSLDMPTNGEQKESSDFAYDIVFLGNLRTENNVAGVLWFLQEVLPKLKIQAPDIRVLIAGSNPVQSIFDACDRLDNVDLKPNPVSAKTVYQSGKVLINPIATGSGVSIKSVDMLTLNRPIVSLKKGTFGLPEAARQYYKIAEDAQSFCDLICKSLSESESNTPNPSEVQELFGYPVIERFLQDLETVVAQHS